MKLAILSLSVLTIAALLYRERRRAREAQVDGFASQFRAMVASPVATFTRAVEEGREEARRRDAIGRVAR